MQDIIVITDIHLMFPLKYLESERLIFNLTNARGDRLANETVMLKTVILQKFVVIRRNSQYVLSVVMHSLQVPVKKFSLTSAVLSIIACIFDGLIWRIIFEQLIYVRVNLSTFN